MSDEGLDPSSAPPEPTAPPARRISDLLGWRARTRPSVRLGLVAGGAGGVMAAVGTAIIGADQASDGGDGTVGAVLGVVLVLLGAIAVLRGPLPAQAAGTAAMVLGVALFCFFAFFVDSPSTDHIKTAMLVSALVWLALYFFGPARGHTAQLGAAVLVFWIWLLVQVGADIRSSTSISAARDVTDGVSSASMILGGVYLVLGAFLDRSRYRGAATALFAGAIVALLGGAGGFSSHWTEVSGVLGMVAGAALLVFGALGRRRGTAWFGAIGLVGGLITLVSDLVDDEPILSGCIVIAVGAAVALVAAPLAARLGEPANELELEAAEAS